MFEFFYVLCGEMVVILMIFEFICVGVFIGIFVQYQVLNVVCWDFDGFWLGGFEIVGGQGYVCGYDVLFIRLFMYVVFFLGIGMMLEWNFYVIDGFSQSGVVIQYQFVIVGCMFIGIVLVCGFLVFVQVIVVGFVELICFGYGQVFVMMVEFLVG